MVCLLKRFAHDAALLPFLLASAIWCRGETYFSSFNLHPAGHGDTINYEDNDSFYDGSDADEDMDEDDAVSLRV